MGDPYRPPRTRIEALDRAQSSMAPGSWHGKIAQAMPVRQKLLDQVEGFDEEQIDALAGSLEFEADDVHVITAEDISIGKAVITLSHKPRNESIDARWRTVPQEPTEYSVNYQTRAVDWPLSGFERVGDRLWCHYAYLEEEVAQSTRIIAFGSSGWKYLPNVAANDTVDRSAPGFDDSSWATGTAPLEWSAGSSKKLWMRRTFPLCTRVTMHFYIEDHGNIYINGNKVIVLPYKGPGVAHSDKTIVYSVPESALNSTGVNTLAIEAIDDNASATYADADLWGELI